MTLATLLSVNAIVALAYALGLLLVPATLLKVYGITSGPGERLMAQFFGVALLAVGLLTWLARNVADPIARRAFVLALDFPSGRPSGRATGCTLRRDECCGLVSS